MYKGTSTYHINSCETIEIFYDLRTDLDKLKYAMHIVKIVNDVAQENQNSYNILQLLLNTLYTIAKIDKSLELVLSVFKLRIACILGFTPIVGRCIDCGEKHELYKFSLKDNGFKCEVCSRQDKSTLIMSQSSQNAVLYTITAPAKKLYNFNLKDDALEEFKLITKLYFNEKMEKEYKIDEKG